MDPVTGVVEKKVTESAWAYLRGWFTRNQELKKQIETLQVQLAEERSGRLAFEKLMSELKCRRNDDNMYWKKDGSGGPYCPICLHDRQKQIPMTHSAEGAFYCRIHQCYFLTEEFRERERNRVNEQPRRPSGPHSWMGS